MVKDLNDLKKDRISEPLAYYLKFEKQHIDAHGFSTLLNVLFYCVGTTITRENIDSMRRKLNKEDIAENLPLEESKDLRELTDYDPDKDDRRVKIDEKLGFVKASH